MKKILYISWPKELGHYTTLGLNFWSRWINSDISQLIPYWEKEIIQILENHNLSYERIKINSTPPIYKLNDEETVLVLFYLTECNSEIIEINDNLDDCFITKLGDDSFFLPPN